MLYQVLQLTPEQINALPPAERDAIQQLVGSRTMIHVASSVWKADSSFVRLFTCILASALCRGVSSWAGASPLDGSISRPRVSAAIVAGFWVYVSHD
jgi:hypothetical protein